MRTASRELKKACEEKKFLKPDGETIDRTQIARAITDLLLDGHTTRATAISIRGIAREIFGWGEDDEAPADAVQLVSSLTSELGKVQRMLNGNGRKGKVLLRFPDVEPASSKQEGRITVRVSKRFVSSAPKEVEDLLLKTTEDALVRKADRVLQKCLLVEKRIPDLRPAVAALLKRAPDKVRLQLKARAGEEESNGR